MIKCIDFMEYEFCNNKCCFDCEKHKKCEYCCGRFIDKDNFNDKGCKDAVEIKVE